MSYTLLDGQMVKSELFRQCAGQGARQENTG